MDGYWPNGLVRDKVSSARGPERLPILVSDLPGIIEPGGNLVEIFVGAVGSAITAYGIGYFLPRRWAAVRSHSKGRLTEGPHELAVEIAGHRATLNTLCWAADIIISFCALTTNDAWHCVNPMNVGVTWNRVASQQPIDSQMRVVISQPWAISPTRSRSRARRPGRRGPILLLRSPETCGDIRIAWSLSRRAVAIPVSAGRLGTAVSAAISPHYSNVSCAGRSTY